jgi:hypothetical protein
VNKKFKKHMEEILYEQEKALMPATQPIIEEMIRKNNRNKRINLIKKLKEEHEVSKAKRATDSTRAKESAIRKETNRTNKELKRTR